MDELELMSKASQLRRYLEVDSFAPIDIFAMAHGICGLTMVLYPMGEHMSGMCVKGEYGQCLIAVNSLMSLGRQRFSIAHELFHKYYDKNLKAICAKLINDSCGREIEKQADVFASHFLMPQCALDLQINRLSEAHDDGELTIEDIVRIEQHFGISHRAAMIRLKFARCFPKDKFESFYNEPDIRRIAEGLGFDGALYLPSPESKRYGCYGAYVGMAKTLLDNDLISNGKFEELLLDGFRADLVYGDEETVEYAID